MDLHRCVLSRWRGMLGRCQWCDAPLRGRSRVWCGKACARAWSENHVWATARQAALDHAGYACRECGSGHELEVHHVPGEAPVGGRRRYGTGCWNHQSKLAVLCLGHHRFETRLERARPDRPLQLELPVAV